MLIRVQRGSSVPISRQIDAQIRSLILSGALRLGEQLPSVRQLAGELAVNVNTVVRVYERLAAEALVEMRHGEGTFVVHKHDAGRNGELAEERRDLSRDLDTLVRRALMLGMSTTHLLKIFEDSLHRVQKDHSGGDVQTSADPPSPSSPARKKGGS